MSTASSIPYNRQSTATQVAADLASSIAGKVVLTTGVSPGGLGANMVETVAQYKPRLLILAGRSPSKVKATADKITSNPDNKGVEVRVLTLDLASQKQVRAAAQEVLAYPEDIDVLVNSAGIMGGPFRTTEEGIELQFGSNHIGHFLFTNLILSKVMASKTRRIVNVSSDGHRVSGVRFDDSSFQNGKVYDQWEAYGQSKSANILFSKALAKKLGPKGLRAYSLHPGVIMGTSLGHEDLNEDDFNHVKQLLTGGKGFDLKSLDEGTATHVVAAFDPRLDAVNGAFLENGNISDNVAPTASKPEDVGKMWKLSEELVGETFEY